MAVQYINSRYGKIAYQRNLADKTGASIIFLGGLMSDMEGTKASYLHQYAEDNNLNYIRFDYYGHGESEGSFIDGNISIWKQNTVDIITELANDKVILIGSSLGGWLMNLVIPEIDRKLQGMIGIAPAPDFSKLLMWDTFDNQIKEQLISKGRYDLTKEYNGEEYSYPITKKFIDDGNNNLILNSKIKVECPVRLLHSIDDESVPYTLSVELMNNYDHDDIQLLLLKDKGHSVSDSTSLQIIKASLEEILCRSI